MRYLEFFIKHKIPVLIDKPITIFNELNYQSVLQLRRDVGYLGQLIKEHKGSRVLVQCQRRNHEGYNYVNNVLKSIILKYNILITYINIMHSDGMWNMPEEFFLRENHPYKYGYGKLAHSGYHFIDLLISLLSLNLKIKGKEPNKISIFSQSLYPFDHVNSINETDYIHFLEKEIMTLPF